MAKKEVVTSNFPFTYAFLKQLADDTVALIDRDVVQFNDRGFTAAKRAALVASITNFDNFPTDESLLGIKVTATAVKDAARGSLEKQMRTIFLSAKNVFTENSGKYREFGDPNLTAQTDSNLVRSAKTLTTAATKYLTDLATEGVTAVKIASVTTARSDLDVAIGNQTIAINNRDNSTETRILLANDLYALVVKYSEVGKDIWVEASEAKYNDYVIYNTPTGTNETPTPPVV